MANSYGTATALDGNAGTLANGAFATLHTLDFGSAPPGECFVQITATASAATSTTTSQSVIAYVRTSLDGTNYSDSGATNNIRNLVRIGSLALLDTSAHTSKAMPIAAALGGALPPKCQIVIENDTGVLLSAGQSGQYITETFG